MSELSLHKWVVGKMLFAVNREEFGDALKIVSDRIQKETNQTPKLSIAFYKASTSQQDPPQILGLASSIEKAQNHLWHKSNRIVATFTTIANRENPVVVATISMGHPTPREIHFHVEPAPVGDKIGRHFLNVEPRFTFWARGIDR